MPSTEAPLNSSGKMKRKRHQEEILSEAALKVLILGDGNLSYSLALAQRLPEAQVLATSYDDSQEARNKYSETSAIVARLEALGSRVQVLHGVDALDIEGSLQAKLLQKKKSEETDKVGDGGTAAGGGGGTGGGSTGEESADAGGTSFDHIIFNHPHTGWEDMHRHTALLAHFLESCKAVLQRCQIEEGKEEKGGAAGGQVHVTLAGDQSKRWKLLETAQRLGFELRHICDFYRQFGPTPLPSQIKRHQSGKSFGLRGLPSFTYTFSLRQEGAPPPSASSSSSSSSASPILWKHSYEFGDHEAAMAQDKDNEPSGTETAVQDSSVTQVDTPITDVVKTMQCSACEKRFRGPKDLKRHVKDAHEAPALEGNEDGGKGPALLCTPCDRQFKDREALEQHNRAKHSGQFQDLKPDWSAAATGGESDEKTQTEKVASLRFKGVDKAAYHALRAASKGEEEGLALCSICDYYVPRDVDHLADLRPPERPTYTCKGCDRKFQEERAVKQHQNSCVGFRVLQEKRVKEEEEGRATVRKKKVGELVGK